jgi:hypothetical protein
MAIGFDNHFGREARAATCRCAEEGRCIFASNGLPMGSAVDNLRDQSARGSVCYCKSESVDNDRIGGERKKVAPTHQEVHANGL